MKKSGVYRYAEHPSTEILCDVSDGDGPLTVVHNAAFERTVLNAKGGAHLTPEGMDCTMARALAHGLPAALFMVGKVLGLPDVKDMGGHALMMKMCRPRKVASDGTCTWWDDPKDRDALQRYCAQDVATERALHARLPALSERERRIWLLDQHINDRGVRVDVPLVRDALRAVSEAKRRADREIWRLTNGAVSTCGQTARIVAWINSRGVPCASIAKGEVEEIVLRADVMCEPVVEDVVTLRRQTSRMFRFDKILDQVCADDRLRGLLQYHKAHTGRWAGWSQSFPRIDDPERVALVIEALRAFHDAAKAIDYIDAAIGPPLETLSQSLRAMVCAPAGKKLVGGDFSNIEGRVAAWFADERWKLEAFEAQDDGTGVGLYEMTAAGILGIDVSAVDRRHRQSHGKVPELACGYQGHVGAFMKMAHTQNPPVKVTHAEASAIVTGWREKNSRIVQSWWDLQDAAIQAVEAKGAIVPVPGDRIRYVSDGKFLYCRLPSGRVVHYASPSVRWRTRTITTEDGDEIELNSRGVSYWGVEFGGRWGQIDLYGGMQFNHVVQGFSRDLLVEAMFAVEAAGYPIVLHTHDDLICEVDEDFGSADELADLMKEAASAMAPGLPVSVKGWSGERWLTT